MGKYITEAYLVLRIKDGNMAAWMKMYLISTGIFLCIDAIWLGFVAYATYDLTNLATIEGWPLFVTVIDLIWGAFVASSTSALSYMLINRFM